VKSHWHCWESNLSRPVPSHFKQINSKLNCLLPLIYNVLACRLLIKTLKFKLFKTYARLRAGYELSQGRKFEKETGSCNAVFNPLKHSGNYVYQLR
jgi:hypothetical protein